VLIKLFLPLRRRSQAAIRVNPPRGVTGHKKLRFNPINSSITNKYIEPENIIIPARRGKNLA